MNLFLKKKSNVTVKSVNKTNILEENTRFDIKEAYNDLRTNISLSIPKDGCRVICFSSSMAAEGKSTTVVNNAINFAKSGSKVLVIDCDLRKPNVSRILNLGNNEGITEAIVSSKDIKNYIKHNVKENLDVICSGNIPPNPAELLSSEKFENIINQLRQNYDYIFIDTPPIIVVTDPVIIAQKCDGIILVVRQYAVDRDKLVEAVNKLDFANIKIIGFVINDVVSTKGHYDKYAYK